LEKNLETSVSPERPSVIILCGGMGIRMGDDRPKMLVEIGGKPILWHVMKIFAAQGFRDFVLALGYRGYDIKRYFMEYDRRTRDFTLTIGSGRAPEFHNPSSEEGWRVTFAETGLHTQTAARIRMAARYARTRTWFVTYGDGVADIDLGKLLDFHRRMGRIATVTGVRSFSRFGVLEANDQKLVTGFDEKPLVDALINGGFFVFEREVIDYLGDDTDMILERGPLRCLAMDGQLAVYEHAGFWRAMDTFKDAQEMSAVWETDAPWKTWDK
jgi:glucose-1-phosphate cytidylyltransferase